jgi:hypothetical protein
MLEKYKAYLDSIQISSPPLLEKVEECLRDIQHFCPEEIRDIHINDYVQEDGTHQYESVECFTDNFLGCVSSFMQTPVVEIRPWPNDMALELRSTNYDFKKASDQSRLAVTIEFSTFGDWEYKASGINCDHLRDMVLAHVSPRLRKGGGLP